MLYSIFIVIESLSRVKRRININALHLPRILLLQRFKREQIVPEDQLVVEEITRSDTMRSMIRLLRIFDENPRFELRPVLLPDRGEVKFLFVGHAGIGFNHGGDKEIQSGVRRGAPGMRSIR